MSTFSGFPDNQTKTTALPGLFFSELLPAIDHLGELKVTLYVFWAMDHKDGRFRYVQRQDMLGDKLLLDGLKSTSLSAEEALDEALERTIARGTLLRVDLDFSDGTENLYFLNNAKGQAAVRAIKSGEWQPSGRSNAPVELRDNRPNIFALYEQNIGPLTPMIADTLRDAETAYSESWIEEAMQIAVENNVRKWSYISAILEGWQTRGKDAREDRGDTEKARRKYLRGWFDD
ncbi:MAG: DnaD domain protein [Chloroflexi bacterium]|nr:DnaD domain protein [Chloroflexota bacterium]